MIEIADLHGQTRYGHAVPAYARVYAADLRLELREYRHDVLKQLRSIVGLDLDVDAVRETGVVEPLRLQNAFGRRAHVSDVRAVGAVHAHAAADRHVADDRVSRHGRAAFRQPHHDVVDAGDADAARSANALAQRRLAPDPGEVDDVIVLELVTQTVGDGLSGGVAETDGRIQIGRRGVVQARSDALEQSPARHVGAQARARQLLLEGLLSGENVLLAALLAEPLLDFMLRAGSLDDREPVER